MPKLSILIKPVSGSCNMDCSYCFYNDVMESRNVKNYGFMSLNTLEEIVSKSFVTNSNAVSFIFQGGEPLLIGLGFYKSFIEYVFKYNINHIHISYSIQTNGTLITKEFAKFFSENKFLIGVSIDGNKEIQNLYRLYKNGLSSFKDTIKGLQYLNNFNVDYNILSVITNSSALNVNDLYSFLKSLETNYFQFIPYISDFINNKNKEFLSNDMFLKFLMELFDLWYNDIQNGILKSIRYFDDILKIILGHHPESCTLQGKCINQNVIEADGSIYPCDFYVLDNWKIGNINTLSFEEINKSEVKNKFITSSLNNHPDCNNCMYYNLCRGGCRRNKELFNDSSMLKTRHCEVYKRFFDYSYDRFIELGNVIRKNNDLL